MEHWKSVRLMNENNKTKGRNDIFDKYTTVYLWGISIKYHYHVK